MKTCLKITICLVIFFMGGVPALFGADKPSSPVAVLLSLKIRPYVEALEGFKAVLSENSGIEIHVYYLQNYTGKAEEALLKQLKQKEPRLLASIGPEAMRFIRRNFQESRIPMLYSMVLNPLEVAGNSTAPLCGVPLNIPWKEQIRQFAGVFNKDKPVGLLFNPLNNARFAEQAVQEGGRQDVRILPLEVSSPQSIPAVLDANLKNLQALWLIPDQTVTSESLIRYIIKTSLSHGVGTIGFNRFFYKNGSAVSFILEYEKIGRQMGDMARRMLTGRVCEQQTPAFYTRVNRRVAERLGLPAEASAPSVGGKQ